MKLCPTLFPFLLRFFQFEDEACALIPATPYQMTQDHVSGKFGLSVKTCSIADMKQQSDCISEVPPIASIS